jgi:hypothetical protein
MVYEIEISLKNKNKLEKIIDLASEYTYMNCYVYEILKEY